MKFLKSIPIILGAASAAAFLLPASVEAQQGDLSARESVGLVSSQFGPRATRWLVELRATGGVPQPSDWEILVLDENAPKLLRRFWAGGGRAGDDGPDARRYPLDLPIGYFSMNMVGVDSVAAFTIAEGEARKARMGFDSCNYLLRVREFSNETIWRLELLDAAQQMVGKIYISGTNGRVLRTMWVYTGERGRPDGLPRIVDSAVPNGNSSTESFTGITGGDTRFREPLPGRTGIADAPMVTNPQPAQPQLYAPVPSGSIGGTTTANPPVAATRPVAPTDEDRRMVEIPPPAPPTSPTASVDDGSSGSGTQQQPMRDLRDPPATEKPDASKPPINVPSGSSSGDSGRIPPPPIPQ